MKTLELRKKGAKGFSSWSIAVEDDCVVTWTDPANRQRTKHGEAWKAANEAQREIRKRMLSGFFFIRPEPEADFGDAIYEGAFKYGVEVFDFHPSGNSIAVAQVHKEARGAEIAVVDFVTGQRQTVLTLEGHPGARPEDQTFIHAVRFDAEGERIVVVLNDEMWALTVNSGRLERLASPWHVDEGGKFVESSSAIPGQLFDGASLARSDRQRRRWTAQDGGDLVVRDERGQALLRRNCRDVSRSYRCACLSPSGHFLACQMCGNDPNATNEIELWNVDDGRLLRSFDISAQAPSDAPSHMVERAFFSEDEGSLLFAFVPGDRGLFSLNLADPQQCVDLSSLVYEQQAPDTFGRYLRHMCDLALSLDGRMLVVAGQGDVRFFEWPAGRLISCVEEEISRYRSLCFSHNARLLASGSASGRLVVRKVVA